MALEYLVINVEMTVDDDLVSYTVCMKFNNTKGLITKL
jgi:hypothetical protein